MRLSFAEESYETNEHGDREDAEIQTVEYRGEELEVSRENGQLVSKESETVIRVKVICSCGSFTCGMIGLYGHPEPVFSDLIEPLFPQARRDQRAMELKAS